MVQDYTALSTVLETNTVDSVLQARARLTLPQDVSLPLSLRLEVSCLNPEHDGGGIGADSLGDDGFGVVGRLQADGFQPDVFALGTLFRAFVDEVTGCLEAPVLLLQTGRGNPRGS